MYLKANIIWLQSEVLKNTVVSDVTLSIASLCIYANHLFHVSLIFKDFWRIHCHTVQLAVALYLVLWWHIKVFFFFFAHKDNIRNRKDCKLSLSIYPYPISSSWPASLVHVFATCKIQAHVFTHKCLKCLCLIIGWYFMFQRKTFLLLLPLWIKTCWNKQKNL